MERLSQLSFKYLKHYKGRTITTIIGVALSTILIYAVFAIGYNTYSHIARNEYKQQLRTDVIYSVGSRDIAETMLVDLLDEKNGVAEQAFMTIFDEGMVKVNDMSAVTSEIVIKRGVAPKNSNQILLGAETAAFYGVKVGSKFNFKYGAMLPDGKFVPMEKEVLLSGIMDDDNGLGYVIGLTDDETYARVDQNMKERENDPYGDINIYGVEEGARNEISVLVRFKKHKNIEAQAKKVAEKYGITNYSVNESALKLYEPEKGHASIVYLGIQAVMLLVAVFISFGMMIIVRNAFNLTVQDRVKDYGILRCIGMSRRDIVKLILFEALIIGIIGATVGIILGQLITKAGFNTAGQILNIDGEMIVGIYPKAIIFTFIINLVITFYSMVSPIEKIYRLTPIESLRKKDEILERRALTKRALELRRKQGTKLSKLFGFEIGYAYKNVMRKKGSFLINVITLMIGAVIFIGINTATNIAVKWMTNNLINAPEYSCELYIGGYANTNDLISDIEGIDGVIDVEKYLYEVYVTDETNEATEIVYLGLSGDLLAEMNKAAGVDKTDAKLPNAIVIAGGANSAKGTIVNIPDLNYSEGTDNDAYICGVVNQEAFTEILGKILSKDSLSRIIKKENVYIFDMYEWAKKTEFFRHGLYGSLECKIKLDHDKDLSKLYKYFNQNGIDYYDYYEEYKDINKSVNTVRRAMTLFAVLVLTIYLTNIINIQSARFSQRSEEFYILFVIGMSEKQKMRMLYAENLFANVIALLLGIVAGSGLGYVIANIITDEICKFYIDWFGIIVCAIILVGAAIITTLLSSRNKIESSETE